MAKTVCDTMLRASLPILLCALLCIEADNDIKSLSSYYNNYAVLSFHYLQKAFFLNNKENTWPGLKNYFFNLAQEKNYAADLIARFMATKNITPIYHDIKFNTTISLGSYKIKKPKDYMNETVEAEKNILETLTQKNNLTNHVKHFMTHWLLDYQYKRLYEVESQYNKINSFQTDEESVIWDRFIVKEAHRIYDYNKFSGFIMENMH